MAVTRVNGGALPIGANNQTLVTGRPMSMYTVTLSNVQNSYNVPDSDFEKLVRAIEKTATIEILGTPGGNAFRVAITGASPTATELELICNTAVATTTVAGFTF